MIGWLLDTNVISTIINPNGAPTVKAWAAAQDESRLFLSVLTLGEYDKGIHNVPDDHPDRPRFIAARDRLAARFSDRTLSIGDAVVRRWGVISGTTSGAPGTRHRSSIHCSPRRRSNTTSSSSRAMCGTCERAALRSLIPGATIRLNFRSARSPGVGRKWASVPLSQLRLCLRTAARRGRTFRGCASPSLLSPLPRWGRGQGEGEMAAGACCLR